MGKNVVEKIFDAHQIDEPYEGVIILKIDRVFCHEITTPLAISDLNYRKKNRVFNREKIKAVIDHVSPAKDSKTALQGKMLREWAYHHRIDFYDVGRNGICHALFPEKGFIIPGHTIVMGDSHTCTYGAFGAFSAGVGTTDLEVAILKGVCAFRKPGTIRINLSGRLAEGVYAKDVILHIIGALGVNGATNNVIEFHGSVIREMSMEARMTISNMVIEAGATCGICLPDGVTVDYLWPFIERKYDNRRNALSDFSRWHPDPDAYYEKDLKFNVSNLEPQVTYGYKPDCVKPVTEMLGTKVDQVYIGTCTNGRIEDLRQAAEIIKDRKIDKKVRAIVTPATSKIYNDALKEGIIQTFVEAGFCVTNPTCGACLGMSNGVLSEGEVCASTSNRNFSGRMGKGGKVYLMSPATAAATAVMGKIADARIFKRTTI